MTAKAESIVIADWDVSRGWAGSDGFTRKILLSRLEPICAMRGTELKRLVRQIRQRKSVIIPLKDDANIQTFTEYLRSFGAKLKTAT